VLNETHQYDLTHAYTWYWYKQLSCFHGYIASSRGRVHSTSVYRRGMSSTLAPGPTDPSLWPVDINDVVLHVRSLRLQTHRIDKVMCLVFPCSSPSTVKQNYSISLFPKEITVHSGIVWRDKIYGDRRQICERVEVSTIKFQLFKRPKMKYLLFNLNVCCHISCPSNMGFARLDSGLWEMASSIPARAVRYSCPGHPQSMLL
jgi:hypothetical protein